MEPVNHTNAGDHLARVATPLETCVLDLLREVLVEHAVVQDHRPASPAFQWAVGSHPIPERPGLERVAAEGITRGVMAAIHDLRQMTTREVVERRQQGFRVDVRADSCSCHAQTLPETSATGTQKRKSC